MKTLDIYDLNTPSPHRVIDQFNIDMIIRITDREDEFSIMVSAGDEPKTFTYSRANFSYSYQH